jgi:uncharacterized protein with von Willebrand factor type A (vWA) domain
MADRSRRHRTYRYTAWRGGRDPLAPAYDVRQALDALGEKVLAGGNLREALHEMLRQGLPGEDGSPDRQGLDGLQAQAVQLRREATERSTPTRADDRRTRPAETRLTETRLTETRLTETRPIETRPAETRPDVLPRSAAATVPELADLDNVIDSLGQQRPGATLDDTDVETVQRLLGTSAADDVAELQRVQHELERQGWLTRDDDGLRLTPKALRRLGQTALRKVFPQPSTRGRGEHDQPDAGTSGEPTGASRAWEFGDEQPLDAIRTVSNAVRRTTGSRLLPADPATSEPDGRQAGAGVQLAVADFEVVETERQASAAVAMCVDLSYSMVTEGRWGPMKQTALALEHLLATTFPQDALQIIGFSQYAHRLGVADLAAVEPDYVQGTNLQHALQLAGRHLRRHPEGEPVVLVVTDGEPTAHLTGTGTAAFCWPPSRETVTATVAEIDELTRFGAAINIFMLGEDPGLRRFVDAVARRSGGRVLTPAGERLDRYVIAEYVRARRGTRRGTRWGTRWHAGRGSR